MSPRTAQAKRYGKIFLAHLFSNVGLCALVVGYSLIGALTFEAIESSYEVKKRTQIMTIREDCLKNMWDITEGLNVLYDKNWTTLVRHQLKQFELKVVNAVKNDGYDGKDAEEELQWSFSGALLYSITVITTIGYGNIAPKTDIGKIVTILYALIGIPLMLMCLSNIGNILAQSFKFSYSRICCILCRIHKRRLRELEQQQQVIIVQQQNQQQPQTSSLGGLSGPPQCQETICTDTPPSIVSSPPGEDNKCPVANNSDGMTPHNLEGKPTTPQTPKEEEGDVNSAAADISEKPRGSEAESSPNNVVNKQPVGFARDNVVVTVDAATVRPEIKDDEDDRVPMRMVFFLVAGYIFSGALLFSLWEDWSILNGAYFCFITLSTIGFGDLVPGGDTFDAKNGQAKLIICCLYLLIGLSIIAMSFNLVQEEVVIKCKNIAKTLGILETHS